MIGRRREAAFRAPRGSGDDSEGGAGENVVVGERARDNFRRGIYSLEFWCAAGSWALTKLHVLCGKRCRPLSWIQTSWASVFVPSSPSSSSGVNPPSSEFFVSRQRRGRDRHRALRPFLKKAWRDWRLQAPLFSLPPPRVFYPTDPPIRPSPPRRCRVLNARESQPQRRPVSPRRLLPPRHGHPRIRRRSRILRILFWCVLPLPHR